ncbi:DUF3027 domain-containing protein [Arthrobacter sp. ISL-48]|uniref:DUF3027 domain-containing protein n=1 Tax=Arthrobacter sp. ISL-48 TaxID=2819110 RepID=UPI0037BE66D5
MPVWRTGKPDAVLAAAVDVARIAIEGITAATDIGRHMAAKSEGDRLVTHLFESKLPGYLGWQWYAVLTRNSRSKVVTVNELGLLPSEDSILPPEWVPWAERVRPEDAQDQESANQDSAGQDLAAQEPADDDGPTDAAVGERTGMQDSGDAADAEDSLADEDEDYDETALGATTNGAGREPAVDDDGTADAVEH